MNLVVSTASPDRPLPARLASTLEWASAFLKRNRESIADLRRKAAAADGDVFTRGAGKLYQPLIEERERMESEIVRDVKLEASIFGWTVEPAPAQPPDDMAFLRRHSAALEGMLEEAEANGDKFAARQLSWRLEETKEQMEKAGGKAGDG